MHRSMKESEPAHKTSSAAFESKLRAKESGHAQGAAHIHAIEKATVPDGDGPTHTAVKHSVGRYVERDAAKRDGDGKKLRRERA